MDADFTLVSNVENLIGRDADFIHSALATAAGVTKFTANAMVPTPSPQAA